MTGFGMGRDVERKVRAAGRTGGEVPGGVGGALLVVQQREGVQLVRGAGRQVAQRVRPVAGALHAHVARAALRTLRQRDHLRTAGLSQPTSPPLVDIFRSLRIYHAALLAMQSYK
jgi:hypothetical protein